MTGIIIAYFPLLVWLTISFSFSRKIIGDTLKTFVLFLIGGSYVFCYKGLLTIDDFHPMNVYQQFQEAMNWNPPPNSFESSGSLFNFLYFNCALMLLTILFTCAIPYCLSSSKK